MHSDLEAITRGVGELSVAQAKPELKTAQLARVPLFTDGVMICLDLEHTGGASDVREIIQLAAVCVDRAGDVVGAPFDEYVWTEAPINGHAGAVHGITKEKLREEARGDFAVVGPLFLDWLVARVAEQGASEATLVAHNGVACDFRLIAVALAKYGLELPTTIRWQLLDSLSALRAARTYDAVEEYPKRGVPTDKEPRGRPSLALMVLTKWLLATRAKYAHAGPDGARATVEGYCGEAHDALADVKALVVVLTDEEGLWRARSTGLACALSPQPFLEYGVKMMLSCQSRRAAAAADNSNRADTDC